MCKHILISVKRKAFVPVLMTVRQSVTITGFLVTMLYIQFSDCDLCCVTQRQ